MNESGTVTMAFERHMMTGPALASGIIALHVAESEEPMITVTFFAMRSFVSCTATCGLEPSSETVNLTGRPAIPPV